MGMMLSVSHAALPAQKFGILNGKYDDFNTDWYCNVGVTFVLILIIDNVTFNLFAILSVIILTIKRALCSRNVCVGCP